MSDEIMFTFGEDGVARKYDDTWDITIHCESEEEQKLVREKLNSLSQELKNSSDGDVISRRFVELLAEYHDPELCSYKEYKGKPYFSIKYTENGEEYIGYSTYSPKVLSQYLREYFTVPVQPEQTRAQMPLANCISKRAAIDALCSECQGRCVPCGNYPCGEVNAINALPSAQPEPSTEIQEILNYLDTTLHPIVSPDNWNVYSELHDMVSRLPSAQPEIIHCKECKFAHMTYDGDCKYCDVWFPDESEYLDGDYYCASAERRTDE